MNTAGLSGAPLRFLGLAAGGLGLVAALAAATAPSPPRPPITKFGGALAGVSAVSPADAWAVGATIANTALILHWNGTGWTRVTGLGPANELLNGVSALSASDAWAVGTRSGGSDPPQTVVLHWNGSSWTRVASPSPDPGGDSLSGVSALSPSDAWAVGLADVFGKNKPLVLHWNGTAWTQVPSPNLSQPAQLSAVSAASPSDVWAVGASATSNPRTLVLHWNGTAWAQVPSPNPGIGHSALSGVDALSPSDAWAVGSYDTGRGTRISSKNLVLHWNGASWTQVASPSPGPAPTDDFLGGVSALSPSDAWAVGLSLTRTNDSRTVVLHWNGASWTQVASPSPAGQGGSELLGVSARSAGDAWAVGLVVRHNLSTLVLHWNGARWIQS